MTKPLPIALILAAALVPTQGAFAVEATPAGADALKGVLERYLGHPAPGEAGSVSVTPAGQAYRASFDLKRMMAPFESFGLTLDPAVPTILLTPNDDGTWTVAADSFPLLTLHMKEQTMTLKSGSYAFQGLFDPKLGGFKTATATQDASTTDQESPSATQRQRIGRIAVTQTMVPAAGDTASIAIHYAMTDIADDMEMRPPKPAASVAVTPTPPPLRFSYRIPSTTSDVTLDQVHGKALLELWAFLVAHPGKDGLAAAQDQLKTAIRAALPLFADLRQTGSADDFSLTTDIGTFSVHKIAGQFALESRSPAGAGGSATGANSLAVGIGIDGLKVPSTDLPVWSVGLLPTGLELKPTVTGFDIDAGVKTAVDSLDLKAADPFTPAQRDSIGKAFLPADATLKLAPSRITSGLLDLKFDGEASLGAQPAGHLTVTATGLDRAIGSLQEAAATDPTAAQVMAQLVTAKTLGKAAPDGSTTWLLEAKPGAAVTVNGVPLQ